MRNDVKLAEEQAKMKRYCQWCGHTMTFYAFEPNKKICHWCKRYTYKDKKSEFEDKLKLKIKEV